MTSRRYKLMYTTDTGKLIFLYNALLKIWTSLTVLTFDTLDDSTFTGAVLEEQENLVATRNIFFSWFDQRSFDRNNVCDLCSTMMRNRIIEMISISLSKQNDTDLVIERFIFHGNIFLAARAYDRRIIYKISFVRLNNRSTIHESDYAFSSFINRFFAFLHVDLTDTW